MSIQRFYRVGAPLPIVSRRAGTFHGSPWSRSYAAHAPDGSTVRTAADFTTRAGVSPDVYVSLGVSRPTIYKCVDKALAAGVRTGLRDRYHRPREPEILPDAKARVVSVTCQQPKALGLAAELWTLSALAAHLQREAEAVGFPRLSRIGKSSGGYGRGGGGRATEFRGGAG